MSPEQASLARAAAQAFRLGLTARGSELLARLVDALLGALTQPGASAAELAPRVAIWSEAQQRGDWVGLADALEFGDARRKEERAPCPTHGARPGEAEGKV